MTEKRKRGRPVGTTAQGDTDAVREFRTARGWSQERLARELNCSLSAVRQAERDRRLFTGYLLMCFERLKNGGYGQ